VQLTKIPILLLCSAPGQVALQGPDFFRLELFRQDSQSQG
jgi:hypothetical protein